MNQGNARRKTLYVLAIVGLLIPLYMLGQPASSGGSKGDVRARSQGGTLAQLREKYEFGQTSLGDLDPASETMRLATLGLRGVAATILWQKADYYKEEKYWDRLSATLNQLSLLQPHFVSVWDKQAHNLSYNVSAEFDDYRQRYLWVKKGIDHLVRGTNFNRRQPMMPFTLGKYTTQKFGRSDEKRQFRDLFRADEPFHRQLNGYGIDLDQPETRGADGKPDNWLVGRVWYQRAYQLVDAGAKAKKTPLYFYMESPLALMYYSEAIESEGVLDDRAMFAWSRASDAWTFFGDREIPTSRNVLIRLRGLAAANYAAAEARQKFDEFTREIQSKIIEEGRSRLTDDEYSSLLKPATERDESEAELATTAMIKIMPIPSIIAQRMPREKRAEAIELGNDMTIKTDYASHLRGYREQSNYDYWEALAELEQTPTAVAARRQVYEAEKYLIDGDLENAVKHFDVAWKNWDKVLRKYPIVIHDEACDRLLTSINRYSQSTNEGKLPDDFPLDWFYRYRAIRDTNKAGEDSYNLYQGFRKYAATFDAKLDEPFELDDHSAKPAATSTAQKDAQGSKESPVIDNDRDRSIAGKAEPSPAISQPNTSAQANAVENVTRAARPPQLEVPEP